MLHTLVVVGAALMLALLGSVLLAPLSSNLGPSADAPEWRGPRARINPEPRLGPALLKGEAQL